RAGAPPGVAAGDRGGARGHPALVRVQLVRARLGAAGHAVDEGQRRLGRVRVLERAAALPAQVPGGHGAVVPARARRAGRVGRAAGRAPAAGLGAVGHYAAYCLLHTAPYHWYYAPLIIGTTLCAAIVAVRARWAVVA